MKRIRQIPHNIESHIGWYTGIVCLISGIALEMPMETAIAGGILYSMVLAKKYVDHRITKEVMDTIELDRVGESGDNPLKPTVVSELLGNYVEDCFNRDVLFFNVIKDDDYVDSTTEKRLLNDLCDSAAANMSRPLRNKLSLYYGEDSLDKVIGRKCLSTVTIFVATHNHKIYDGTSKRN